MIQPSSDARATAIAVAYALLTNQQDVKQQPRDVHEQAKLIGQLAQMIHPSGEPSTRFVPAEH
jgi:hypothetical protein